jgi:hypothetical protein
MRKNRGKKDVERSMIYQSVRSKRKERRNSLRQPWLFPYLSFLSLHGMLWIFTHILLSKSKSISIELTGGNGYEGDFYKMKITYYDEDGLVYWTMGAPLSETTIINRCKKENSYEHRLANVTLPE